MFDQNGTFETVGNSSFPFFDYDFIRSFWFRLFSYFFQLHFCTPFFSDSCISFRISSSPSFFFFFSRRIALSIRNVVQLDTSIIANLVEFTPTKYHHKNTTYTYTHSTNANFRSAHNFARQSEKKFRLFVDFVGRFACQSE